MYKDFMNPHRIGRKMSCRENLVEKEKIDIISKKKEREGQIRPYRPGVLTDVPSNYRVHKVERVEDGDVVVHIPFDTSEVQEVYSSYFQNQNCKLQNREPDACQRFKERRKDVFYEPTGNLKTVLRKKEFSYETNNPPNIFNNIANSRFGYQPTFLKKKEEVDPCDWVKDSKAYCFREKLSNVIEMIFEPTNQHLIVCGGTSTMNNNQSSPPPPPNNNNTDELLCCYDLNRGVCCNLGGEHKICVSDIKFTPGEHDKRLVSCGHDGKIIVWKYGFYYTQDNEYYTNSGPGRYSTKYFRQLKNQQLSLDENNGFYVSQKEVYPDQRLIHSRLNEVGHPTYEVVISKHIADVECLWIEFGERGRVYVSDSSGDITQVRYTEPYCKDEHPFMRVWKNPVLKIDEIILSPTHPSWMYCFNECSSSSSSVTTNRRRIQNPGKLGLFDLERARDVTNFSNLLRRGCGRRNSGQMILETVDVGCLGNTNNNDMVALGLNRAGKVYLIQDIRSPTRNVKQVGQAGPMGTKADYFMKLPGDVKRLKFDRRRGTRSIWYAKNSQVFGFDMRNLDTPVYLWSPSLQNKEVTDFTVGGGGGGGSGDDGLLCIATGEDLHIFDTKKNRFIRQITPEGGRRKVSFSRCKFQEGPPKMLMASTEELNCVHVYRENSNSLWGNAGRGGNIL